MERGEGGTLSISVETFPSFPTFGPSAQGGSTQILWTQILRTPWFLGTSATHTHTHNTIDEIAIFWGFTKLRLFFGGGGSTPHGKIKWFKGNIWWVLGVGGGVWNRRWALQVQTVVVSSMDAKLVARIKSPLSFWRIFFPTGLGVCLRLGSWVSARRV